MRPLQSIAMGLVVIALHAELGGFDALPDPLGWVLVLLGTVALPEDLGRRRALTGLALVAGAVAVPLWWPGVAERLYDLHPSLGWAVNLPQLGYLGLLSLVLARRSAAAGDTRSSAWLRTALVGVVLVAVLPVAVFGAGVASLELTSYLAASAILILLVCLLFRYSGRPWLDQAPPKRNGRHTERSR